MDVAVNKNLSHETVLRVSPRRGTLIVEMQKPDGAVAHKEISPLCQTLYNRSNVNVIVQINRSFEQQSRLLVFGSLECGKTAAQSADFPQQSILIESDLLIYINQSINLNRALAAIRIDGIDRFDAKENPLSGGSNKKTGNEIYPSHTLRSGVFPEETAEPKVPLSQQVRNFDCKIPLVRGDP